MRERAHTSPRNSVTAWLPLSSSTTKTTGATCAPITSTVKGLSSEVPVGAHNGLDHAGVVSLDNVVTIPTALLERAVGFLLPAQEAQLAKAIVLAYDLDLPLLD